MGLCKCERKKVTNLFCFQHRVNVCEFCLLSDHVKCIVKSYLQWLKDSDFYSVCSLCSRSLDADDRLECVRLMCLDVFHWKCIDKFASVLPSNTAPAGYECPLCSECIIPLSNQGGPIAEALRTRLETASWMKPNLKVQSNSSRLVKAKSHLCSPPLTDFNEGKLLDPSLDAYAAKFLQGDERAVYVKPVALSPSVMPIDENATTVAISSLLRDSLSMNGFDRKRHVDETIASSSFATRGSSSSQQLLNRNDVEVDKYRRRDPMKTIEQSLGFSELRSSFKSRRCRIVGFIGLIALIFLVFMLILNVSSDPNGTGDLLLDPMLNPEIHVAVETEPKQI